MSTYFFVDVNCTGDTETRVSRTGILLFCNSAPIIWFSKRQNSVEESTFGSECNAMKNLLEIIEAFFTSCACLGFQLMDQQISLVTTGRSV